MRLRFKFKKGMMMFSLFFLILFIALGIWQVNRYDEKKALLHTWEAKMYASPITWAALKHLENPAFQPVKLIGAFQNQDTIFYQNQYRDGITGVDVLTPFIPSNAVKTILVDRGWIPLSKVNSPIKAIKGKQTFTAYVKVEDKSPFILGKNVYYPNERPLKIQKIDFSLLSRLLHRDFYPHLVRLTQDSPFAYDTNWVVTSMKPARHMGYAIQWFAMALVLVVAFFVFSHREAMKHEQ